MHSRAPGEAKARRQRQSGGVRRPHRGWLRKGGCRAGINFFLKQRRRRPPAPHETRESPKAPPGPGPRSARRRDGKPARNSGRVKTTMGEAQTATGMRLPGPTEMELAFGQRQVEGDGLVFGPPVRLRSARRCARRNGPPDGPTSPRWVEPRQRPGGGGGGGKEPRTPTSAGVARRA